MPLAARVNDQPIFLDTYEKQFAQFEQALTQQGIDITSSEGQAIVNQLPQTVLDGLIEQLIIEQQAENEGISISDHQVEAQAQEAISRIEDQAQFENWLANNNLTHQEFMANLRSQLIANQMFERITQNVPETADQIHLSIIKVEEIEKAQAVVEQLENRQEFGILAQEQSLDEPSRANGGDLGWFPQNTGVVPPEVEAVAFSLQPGQMSGPIQTSAGFYIIKLEERETERPLTNEYLYILKKQIFDDWLMQQRSSATIEQYVAR